MPNPAARPLDAEDDVERELGEILVSGGATSAAVDTASTLSGLGLDGLGRAYVDYHVQRAFHLRLDEHESFESLLSRVKERAYWKYPAPPGEGAADLARSDFAARFMRPPFHATFRGLARLLFGFRVEGREHIPREGPFVLVANHAGHPDAVVLMSSVPLSRVNDAHPLGAQDYFFRRKWIGRSVHGFLNVLPIDRHANIDRALGDGLSLLDEGHGLILFPEGTRSADGQMGSFKKGVGFLLAGKSWPAVPAYITGSRDVMPKGRNLPRLAPLSVRIGPPRTYQNVDDDRAGWKQVAADLERAVRDLGPAEDKR